MLHVFACSGLHGAARPVGGRPTSQAVRVLHEQHHAEGTGGCRDDRHGDEGSWNLCVSWTQLPRYRGDLYQNGFLNTEVHCTQNGVLNTEVHCTQNGVLNTEGYCTQNGVLNTEVHCTQNGVLNTEAHCTQNGVLNTEVHCTQNGVLNTEVHCMQNGVLNTEVHCTQNDVLNTEGYCTCSILLYTLKHSAYFVLSVLLPCVHTYSHLKSSPTYVHTWDCPCTIVCLFHSAVCAVGSEPQQRPDHHIQHCSTHMVWSLQCVYYTVCVYIQYSSALMSSLCYYLHMYAGFDGCGDWINRGVFDKLVILCSTYIHTVYNALLFMEREGSREVGK